MMRKNSDFSHVDTAVKNCRILLMVALGFCVAGVIYFGMAYSKCENYCWESRDPFLASMIAMPFLMFYLFILKKLFLVPLRSHAEWVAGNGIFQPRKK